MNVNRIRSLMAARHVSWLMGHGIQAQPGDIALEFSSWTPMRISLKIQSRTAVGIGDLIGGRRRTGLVTDGPVHSRCASGCGIKAKDLADTRTASLPS